ncbi:YifB family Mg chelatase-like AAA ATPase [Paenibacillus alvei]|uniref:Competence protein ComM n=1 Tax=Paenibacillus alvei TaxID=44250 RepID=A0A383R8X8_PAEAL|nr:YifB family Mg chelatase-like AAA ATPase [Paenibacillus alvei]SYX82786.1 Competence protein ComM [Paenibacillus alvei]
MYGNLWGASVYGVEGRLIHVEIDISPGLPQVTIVGLPDAAIRESIERVRAAVRNCGWKFPLERITINLAPADLRKEGTSFDIAMAIGLLCTSGQIPNQPFEEMLLIGELALDGSTRAVPGVLSLVDEARRRKFTRVMVPADNVAEALLVEGIQVFPLRHLSQLRDIHSVDDMPIASREARDRDSSEMKKEETVARNLEDYADVNGQLHVKRALIVAAAGMHNVLLSGPPGTGKTMLIKRLPTILPPMNEAEALEVSKIYSVSGKWSHYGTGLMMTRPFRSPHHSISAAGLIGGGAIPKPGEISLAHRGVLFLDELPEFPRQVLEVLRQPLEERSVTIGRARAVFRFPAHVMLAASMNPCPCGYAGSRTEECRCSHGRLEQYRSKLSGPLLDRIDVQVEVPRSPISDWSSNNLSSEEMRKQVMRAQRVQAKRYEGMNIQFNSELSGSYLKTYCCLSDSAKNMLQQAYDQLGMSARAHDRLLKLSRTIADIEGSEVIEVAHVAEAIQYRTLDKRNHA